MESGQKVLAAGVSVSSKSKKNKAIIIESSPTDLISELQQLREENSRLKDLVALQNLDLERFNKSKRNSTLLMNSYETRLKHLDCVNELVEAVTLLDDLDHVWGHVKRLIRGIINCDFICLFIEELNLLYIDQNYTLNEDQKLTVKELILQEYHIRTGILIPPPLVKVKGGEDIQPNVLPSLEDDDFKLLLTHPLRTRSQVIGCLSFISNPGGIKQLGPYQSESILNIVHVASLILDNAILYQKSFKIMDSLDRKVKSLGSLLEIGRAIVTHTDTKRMLDTILSIAMQEIRATSGALMLIERNNYLKIESSFGLTDFELKGFEQKVGEGVVGRVALDKEPLVLYDISLKNKINCKKYNHYYIDFSQHEENPRLKSSLYVPLLSKQDSIGVLNVTSEQFGFSDDDCDILTIFATQATQTIENSRLIQAEKHRVSELLKLNEIGKSLSSALNYDDIFRTIMDALSELFDYHVGALLLENNNSFKLTLMAFRQLSSEIIDHITDHMTGSFRDMTLTKLDSTNLKKQFLTNIHSAIPAKYEKPKSFLMVPLIIRGKIFGLLAVYNCQEDAFNQDNMRTISTLTSQLSIAIDKANAYQKIETSFKEVSMLLKVSKTINSTLDLSKILQLIVTVSAKLVNAKISFLRLLDEETSSLMIRSYFGVSEQTVNSSDLKIHEGLSAEVLKTGQPVVVSDIQSSEIEFEAKLYEIEKIRSAAAVPLIIKSKVTGVISVYFDELKQLNESEVNFLSALASQASVSIENANLYATMEKNFISTITALSAAIDAKDHYTHGHSKNVMEYAVAIAREMKLSDNQIRTIRFAGLLHDIGKIGISESILRKQEKLTNEEFDVIATHPRLGAFIMEGVEFLKEISPLTYHHHERYDGSGYPDGLNREDIPLGARILSVADGFDVMTSNRPYRKALQFSEAISELRRCSGTQFDPKVVEVFLRLINRVCPDGDSLERVREMGHID